MKSMEAFCHHEDPRDQGYPLGHQLPHLRLVDKHLRMLLEDKHGLPVLRTGKLFLLCLRTEREKIMAKWDLLTF